MKKFLIFKGVDTIHHLALLPTVSLFLLSKLAAPSWEQNVLAEASFLTHNSWFIRENSVIFLKSV